MILPRHVRTLAATAAVALAALIGGCGSPAPAPTPTPTGFASEAEAFAAAEETYRAYVDALNQRRTTPDAVPSPQDFLVGTALETDAETQRQLQETGLRVIGHSVVERVIPADAHSESDRDIWIVVCLNSADTQVVDAADEDRTPSERATISLMEVHLVLEASRWLITSSQLISEGQC